MSDLKTDFLAQGLLLEETHISQVFLGTEEVWKIKKPVDFGFLDFRSVNARRQACESEIRLNSRFSPEIYLGLVPITMDKGGIHRLGGDGNPVDWAVHMRRMPDYNRADRRLATGRLPFSHLRRLAERMAAYHASAPCDALQSGYGSPKAVFGNVQENFIQTRPYLAALIGDSAARELEGLFHENIFRLAPVMEERVKAGRIRDGHGDLRLSQIYFDDVGNSTLLDCVEFNDRFRFGDVCSDVAFLSMDLSQRGWSDLGENFLAAYARASGDYGLYQMVDFYQAYRACVRGKVRALSVPGIALAEARQSAEAGARDLFLFALACLRTRVSSFPVIAVGGGIGTGKTTLAEALGEFLRSPVISSDQTRKRLAGKDPLAHHRDSLWQGLYSEEATEKTHEEMRRLAAMVWESGRPIILDASFRSRKQRSALREAAVAAGHPFLFIECRAGAEECRLRLRKRAMEPSASDGDEFMFEKFLADWEPVENDPAEKEHLVVDTSGPIQASLAKAIETCRELSGAHGAISVI